MLPSNIIMIMIYLVVVVGYGTWLRDVVAQIVQARHSCITAVAVEVLLKCCINSFAHKNKLIWQLMELFTNLKNLIILVTSCFVVIGHLCQS